MANPDSCNPKSTLRDTMRRRLHGLNADSQPVCSALEQWLATLPATLPAAPTVAAFSALPGEVELAETVRNHPAIRWVYPRVADGELRFHRIDQTGCDWVQGKFGILEPSPELPEVGVAEIDVFLCPGLAFDFTGGRLGRGKGFYDRVLARARVDAWKIGICFPMQLVPDTFSEAHDVRMDRVISG